LIQCEQIEHKDPRKAEHHRRWPHKV
jgi:hypothetical protein